MIISLIGPPCAGKGTQARLLQKNHNFYSIGAGDLLRAAAKHDPKCAAILQEGKLIDVTYIWQLMEAEINKQVANGNTNILLDGYPRELSQAQVLDEYLIANNLQIHLVNMHAHTDILLERMRHRVFCDNCGATSSEIKLCCDQLMQKRNDDNEQSFQARLDIFFHNINQVKSFYKDKNTCIWHDMNAQVSIPEMNAFFEQLVK